MANMKIRQYDTKSRICGQDLALISDSEDLHETTLEPIYKNIKLSNLIYTSQGSGVINGGVISRASDTEATITAGKGIIVDWYTDFCDPKLYPVEWVEQTIEITNVTTQDVTRLYVDSTGTVIQKTLNSPSDRRDYIFIGTVAHPTGVVMDSMMQRPVIPYDLVNQFNDLWRYIGYIKDSILLAPYSTNLQLERTAGTVYMAGINYENNPKDPNQKVYSALSPVPNIIRVYKDSGGDWILHNGVSTVDPTKYDDFSGTLQPVSTNQATVQHMFWSPRNDLVYIHYGQVLYNSLTSARTNWQTDIPELSDTLNNEVIYIGALILIGNATDLSDTNQAVFVYSDKFGQLGSAGGGSTSAIPNELVDGSDASAYHIHYSILEESTTPITTTMHTKNYVDTTLLAITINEPIATPVAGDWFEVWDVYGNASTNNITVDFTGSTYEGASGGSYIINTNDGLVRFEYIDTTEGWKYIILR